MNKSVLAELQKLIEKLMTEQESGPSKEPKVATLPPAPVSVDPEALNRAKEEARRLRQQAEEEALRIRQEAERESRRSVQEAIEAEKRIAQRESQLESKQKQIENDKQSIETLKKD